METVARFPRGSRRQRDGTGGRGRGEGEVAEFVHVRHLALALEIPERNLAAVPVMFLPTGFLYVSTATSCWPVS